jgi:hypothetical protein
MHLLSPRAHAIIALLIGLALVLSPIIFSFADTGGRAVMFPRTMGLVIIISELAAENRLIGTRSVSMWLHTRFDMGLGFLIAIGPWLYEYSHYGITTWLPQLLIGCLLILNALVTRSTYKQKGYSANN